MDDGEPVAAQPCKKSSGALSLGVSISSPPDMFILTIYHTGPLSQRPGNFLDADVTIRSSSLANRALQCTGRSAAYDVPCLAMPC